MIHDLTNNISFNWRNQGPVLPMFFHHNSNSIKISFHCNLIHVNGINNFLHMAWQHNCYVCAWTSSNQFIKILINFSLQVMMEKAFMKWTWWQLLSCQDYFIQGLFNKVEVDVSTAIKVYFSLPTTKPQQHVVLPLIHALQLLNVKNIISLIFSNHWVYNWQEIRNGPKLAHQGMLKNYS